MRRALLFVGLLAGCVSADLVPCGDLVCASDAVCVQPNVCATDAQLAACDDLDDGALCRAENIDGSCRAGVCVFDICGDGQLTGGEPCDGDQFATTCADLGFYTGTPTCTRSCSISTTGCAQECGDGVVQADHGEQCDMSVPENTCAEYGRDYGRVTCNEFCAPAIQTDCKYYGWPRIYPELALDDTKARAAAVNAHGAVLAGNTKIIGTWDGVVSTHPFTGAITALSTTSELIVIASDRLAWFDGTWHELALPVVTGSLGEDAFTAEPGAVYRSRPINGGIDRFSLASSGMTSIAAPPGTGDTPIEWLPSYGLYASTSSGVYHFDGTAWTLLAALNAPLQLWTAGPDRLASTTSFFDATSGAVTDHPFALVRSGGWSDDGDYACSQPESTSGDQVLSAYTAVITSALTPRFLDDGYNGVVRGADGRLVAWSIDGLFAVLPRVAEAGANAVADAREIVPQSDGSFSICGSIVSSPPGTDVSLPNNAACDSLVGDGRDKFLAVGASALYYWNGNSFTTELGNIFKVAGDMTHALALSNVGTLLQRNPATATWQTITATPALGCVARQIYGKTFATVRVVWTCGSSYTITSWNGTAFTTLVITDKVIQALATAPDGAMIVQAYPNAIYRVDAGTLQKIGDAQTADGSFVNALDSNDLYWMTGANTIRHWTPTNIIDTRATNGPFLVTPSYITYMSLDQSKLIPRMPVLAGPNGP